MAGRKWTTWKQSNAGRRAGRNWTTWKQSNAGRRAGRNFTTWKQSTAGRRAGRNFYNLETIHCREEGREEFYNLETIHCREEGREEFLQPGNNPLQGGGQGRGQGGILQPGNNPLQGGGQGGILQPGNNPLQGGGQGGILQPGNNPLQGGGQGGNGQPGNNPNNLGDGAGPAGQQNVNGPNPIYEAALKNLQELMQRAVNDPNPQAPVPNFVQPEDLNGPPGGPLPALPPYDPPALGNAHLQAQPLVQRTYTPAEFQLQLRAERDLLERQILSNVMSRTVPRPTWLEYANNAQWRARLDHLLSLYEDTNIFIPRHIALDCPNDQNPSIHCWLQKFGDEIIDMNQISRQASLLNKFRIDTTRCLTSHLHQRDIRMVITTYPLHVHQIMEQWAQERIVLNRHIDNLNAVLGGGFPQQQVQGMSIWEEEEDLAQKTGLTPQQIKKYRWKFKANRFNPVTRQMEAWVERPHRLYFQERKFTAQEKNIVRNVIARFPDTHWRDLPRVEQQALIQEIRVPENRMKNWFQRVRREQRGMLQLGAINQLNAANAAPQNAPFPPQGPQGPQQPQP
ncbi:hypothetical protein MARPO_0153s0042 [Marchantia polymorpha]|uniref:Uncharacterized protein n=1 Tax=Marchantia polymorpha TaxID=3197 RepID=A0A2R6W4V4_MARPO|nr:hypothetical protein MARPO_0153s0042 [Marchantia polymorpha]PTQ28882.1 hypothetical protein MARPO_0153s0042 [Marchantia polymorpha]|eukprot:PTQ28881.1 hypothetical protein MARPO_0153s0042 [Marchantia polymorpha]